MLKLKIDNGSGFVDYTKYLIEESVAVDDSINQPTITSFVLANIDTAFVTPRRGAYVKIESVKYQKNLATGFITQDPEKTYFGPRPATSGFQPHILGFGVTVTSDEWLLNVHTIPFLPAMVNQTMGQIIRLLAETLVPGFYSFDVDDGDIIPLFKYDPKKKLSEVMKEFADSIRYRYKVINRTIYFKPFGDADLGVSYDDTQDGTVNGLFDPYVLNTSVYGTPIVNDVIIIGDVEPRKIREDHFIGTGIDADFILRHKVYGGATALLLEEKWDGDAFADDLWEVVDPDVRFVLNGALNVLPGSGPVSLGTAYIKGRNGVEFGGHLDIEHGELDFTSVSASGGTTGIGIIGGVYNDSSLVLATCENGFYVSGNTIKPIVDGVVGSSLVTVQYNHHYRLQTVISASAWSRYNKLYRTLAGNEFGGTELASEALVTFLIQDIDLANPGTPTVIRHTELMTLSAFGLYAPINSVNVAVVVTYTQIAKPVQGTLLARSLYRPDSGDQLPVRVPGGEEHHTLGFGLQNQTATIADNNDFQLLRFYDDTVPAVGARIRLRTWEAGRAISRVRDEASVNNEAVISGDDGVRSAIITDLNPAPRTSEDADTAAKAYLEDNTITQFNGTYQFPEEYWDGFIASVASIGASGGQDFPRPGRYFNINSPMRGITNRNFVVRRVSTRVDSLVNDRLVYSIEFAPDLFIPKLLPKFFKSREDILIPKDVAERPLIQDVSEIGTSYLLDLTSVQVSGLVTGTNIHIEVADVTLAVGESIEVRRVDSGWGKTDQNLILNTTSLEFDLTRTAYEQIWYFRIVNTGSGKSSRRSAVVRVVYPLVPDRPGGELDIRDRLKPEVHLTIPGDIRNVWGIEIRSCMDSEVTEDTLRKGCGTLYGEWLFNSLVGPFDGILAGHFYGVFASSGKLIAQKSADYGELWGVIDDTQSVLSPQMQSFEARQYLSNIFTVTQQVESGNVARVAFNRLSQETDTWEVKDRLVASPSDAVGTIIPSVSVARRYSASGTVIGILYQAETENVGGSQYARCKYTETLDDGLTWSTPLAVGSVGVARNDICSRVIGDTLTGRMYFLIGDTDGPFGHCKIQVLRANNTLSALSTFFTGGGLSQIGQGRIAGDPCGFTQSGVFKFAVPLLLLEDVNYAIFTGQDTITTADVMTQPTGGPTTYEGSVSTECTEAAIRWDGTKLHLVGKKRTALAGTFIWHKTSNSAITSWTPAAQFANRVGPTSSFLGESGQEVGYNLTTIAGRKYTTVFSHSPAIVPGASIFFALVPVDTEPTEEVTEAEWLANCNALVTDPVVTADILVPIPIVDQGFAAEASVLVVADYVSNPIQFARSEFLFDYTKYADGTRFFFEGTFTNESFTQSRKVNIWKMMRGRTGIEPQVVHTLTIPPQTFAKRIRFSASFRGYLTEAYGVGISPGVSEGLITYEDAYQFELEGEAPYTLAYDSTAAILPNAVFKVHKLQLLAFSQGAQKGTFSYPMASSDEDPTDDDLNESLFSTSSTSYVDIPQSAVFRYNSIEWQPAVTSARVYGTLHQATAGSGVLALVDFDSNAVIAEAAIGIIGVPTAVGVDVDPADLVDGRKYKLQLKSTSGGGTTHFYGQSRLDLSLDPIEKYNIYWRYAHGDASSIENRYSRVYHSPALNSGTITVLVEGTGASGTVALVEGGTSDGSATVYPGWFGYIPVAGHDLDHIPAQTYTDSTNFTTTQTTYTEVKAAGSLTVDKARQYIQEFTTAAWQFQLIAAVVGSSEADQGIIDINALRDALSAVVNAEIAPLLAAETTQLTFTTKDNVRASVAAGTLTSGNRYWGYATGSLVQALLVYQVDATTQVSVDTTEPISTGDVLMRRVYKSPTDLIWAFENFRYKIRELCFDCYFFNLMWEYSEKLNLTASLPAPPAPVIEVVSVLSYDINIRLDVIADSNIDTVSVTVELSTNPDFEGNVTRIKGGPLQSIYSLHAVEGVDAVSHQYIRAKRTDYLGDSEWSETVFISSEALIGSAVQTFTIGNAGVLPTYVGTNNVIEPSTITVVEGRLTSVVNPVAAQDAATKDYVDTLVASVSGASVSGISVSGNNNIRAIAIPLDGGGIALTTGHKVDFEVPYNGVIESVTVLGYVSGSIVLDVWKDTYGSYPPTVADSITASAKPTITSSNKSKDTTLVGWTKTFSTGDTFRINVDSVTNLERVTVIFKVVALP